VIPLQFEEAESFVQGLAAVKENGQWGYINAKGEWAIPPKFAKVPKYFDKGLAVVLEAGKPIYINTKGETVLYADHVCGLRVLKNVRDEISWPKKTAEQICKEQKEE